MQITPASTELGRAAPLAGAAVYLNFISTYGSAIVTTIAILYGLMQFYMRVKEHKRIMTGKEVE